MGGNRSRRRIDRRGAGELALSDFAEYAGPTRALSRALAADRLAHAYLFVGLDRTSKRDFAERLGQAILCERRIACGDCRPCAVFATGTHPDLQVFGRPEGKTAVSIEVTQQMGRFLSRSSFGGSARIAIIDEAERMSDEAANNLLKTLEEPPGTALIILIAERADLLRDTIVSRCHLVRFPRLATETVARELGTDGGLDGTVAAALSGGDISRARRLLNAEVGTMREELLAALSEARGDGLAGAMAKWAPRAKGELLEKRRGRARNILDLLMAVHADCLATATGASVRLNADIVERIGEVGRRLGRRRSLDALAALHQARGEIDANVNVELVFAGLGDRLAEIHTG